MIRKFHLFIAMALLGLASRGFANITPDAAQQLYDRVSPSLVAVQYVWQNELGRHELIGAGVIVSEDGLVMCPLGMFGTQIPDEQMKDFKVIVPKENQDVQELDAIFQGRDERTNLAFIKTKEPQKWKAITFEDLPLKIGEPVFSVGMLPQVANYKTYFTECAVSAVLRGEVPQVLVQGGGLAGMGSPVFNADGKAVGLVSYTPGQSLLLNNPRESLAAINNPPKFFIPAKDFLLSFQDPPKADKPLALPWMGVPQLTGLNKDVAEVYNLTNQPAIQVGEVIPNTPAEKAGLKQNDIIVKMNGKPLERGDEPSELPNILRRDLLRMKVGSTVTFSVLREKDKPLQEIQVTLAEQPKRANLAKRYYAEDLGFAVREMVFYDTYSRHLKPDAKGVVVALTRPQGPAETGQLRNNDLITKMNNDPVTDVDQFQKSYEQLRKDKPREAIVLEIHRENRDDTVRIEPPQ